MPDRHALYDTPEVSIEKVKAERRKPVQLKRCTNCSALERG